MPNLFRRGGRPLGRDQLPHVYGGQVYHCLQALWGCGVRHFPPSWACCWAGLISGACTAVLVDDLAMRKGGDFYTVPWFL